MKGVEGVKSDHEQNRGAPSSVALGIRDGADSRDLGEVRPDVLHLMVSKQKKICLSEAISHCR